MTFTSLFSMIDNEIVSIFPNDNCFVMVHQDTNGNCKNIEIEYLYDEEETKKTILNYDGEKFC